MPAGLKIFDEDLASPFWVRATFFHFSHPAADNIEVDAMISKHHNHGFSSAHRTRAARPVRIFYVYLALKILESTLHQRTQSLRALILNIKEMQFLR
jgi:hypothetical protein